MSLTCTARSRMLRTMREYDRFIFDSYAVTGGGRTVELCYTMDDELRFVETIGLPAPIADPEEPRVKAALFALHLAAGTSYYKTFAPTRMEVRSGQLSEEDAAFWTTVYEKGMGEFFYKNTIDWRGRINFPVTGGSRPRSNAPARRAGKRKLLVPVGGGKDSLVTVELLKQAGHDCALLRKAPHPAIDAVAKTTGLPLLEVTQAFSPLLFELNKAGAMNGHIPFTAHLSALATLVAIGTGHDAVVLSNERSASEGNLEYLGMEVNHQWSKSLEFERLWQAYSARAIDPGVDCFSLLRPLSELQIVQLFSMAPQYFSQFTSCNANWKFFEPKTHSSLWCGKCPKCAFAYCLLSAFLPVETVIPIFGGDLYDREDLLGLYRELLGIEGHKPFECVGTAEEVAAAMLLARKRGDLRRSLALKMFEAEALPGIADPDAVVERSLTAVGDHAIPREFLSVLHAPH